MAEALAVLSLVVPVMVHDSNALFLRTGLGSGEVEVAGLPFKVEVDLAANGKGLLVTVAHTGEDRAVYDLSFNKLAEVILQAHVANLGIVEGEAK